MTQPAAATLMSAVWSSVSGAGKTRFSISWLAPVMLKMSTAPLPVMVGRFKPAPNPMMDTPILLKVFTAVTVSV
ncbi:MAG: hypothetical protein JW384_03970 [Nitrosomonadaceae bacterium]|nr:hypothetical protein [Nitrosomonadaceae bacterium]